MPDGHRSMRPMMVAVLLALFATSCSAVGDPPGEAAEGPEPTPGGPDLHVVTTVAPLADIVQRVLGDRGRAVPLVPPGTDSHTHEPAPGGAAKLSGADAFIGVGLGLNDAALRLAEANLPAGSPLLLLGEDALSEEHLILEVGHEDDHGYGHGHGDGDGHDHGGGANPHIWTSVQLTALTLEPIARALSELDPAGATGYERRAEEYGSELEDLDATISEAVGTIPREHRTLVTYHDAWSYFARDYGLRTVTVVQPSDFSEPSAHDVRRVIDLIRREGVPAVFGSKAFPSHVLDAIAEETGASYVGDLTDDELPGAPGDPIHSYAGMMLANAHRLVESLGGDPRVLRGPGA